MSQSGRASRSMLQTANTTCKQHLEHFHLFHRIFSSLHNCYEVIYLSTYIIATFTFESKEIEQTMTHLRHRLVPLAGVLLTGITSAFVNVQNIALNSASCSLSMAVNGDVPDADMPLNGESHINGVQPNGSTLPVDGVSHSYGEAINRLGVNTGPTVWTEFARLAAEFDPVNLGQGFPDWLPPKFAVDSLVEAVLDSSQSPHQYTRPAGHPHLVNQLAKRYSTHLNRQVDPMNEVAVTVGASQALYLSLQTLIQPGP